MPFSEIMFSTPMLYERPTLVVFLTLSTQGKQTITTVFNGKKLWVPIFLLTTADIDQISR